MDDQQQNKKEEIDQAALEFKRVITKHGAKAFFFVFFPEDVSRFFDSNFAPADSAYHYLNQSVTVDYTLKVELERWKNVVLGTQQPFSVICISNTELERFLTVGRRYIVISVLRALDGYCFVLSTEDGKYVRVPANFSGFHSTRFVLDVETISMN